MSHKKDDPPANLETTREDGQALDGAEHAMSKESVAEAITKTQDKPLQISGTADRVVSEVVDDKKSPVPLTPEDPEEVKAYDKWLEQFYKECGREVTLAYTTLNQMKNWAMLIVGAFITAVVGFSKPAPGASPVPFEANIAVFIGAALAYVFILRFFVRAILCYINLLRWNRLQADVIAWKLRIPSEDSATKEAELKSKLTADINVYYHQWRATIDRKSQLYHNLKLGFALFLALPLFFVVVGAITLWQSSLVKGLTFFVFGNTLVELLDFFRSPYFDTPEKAEKRRVSGKGLLVTFPVPTSRGGYLLSWFGNLAVSIVIALWPKLAPSLNSFLDQLRQS